MFTDPTLAQAFKRVFSDPQVKCESCGSTGDSHFHDAEACAVIQQVKEATNGGYLRASQIIKQATEAQRAADDIEANVNKAAKAHAHQLRTGMRDQINDKTGAFQ
jgi:hypothetical protein